MKLLKSNKTTFFLTSIVVLALGTFAVGQGRVAGEGARDAAAPEVHNHFNYGDHYYRGGAGVGRYGMGAYGGLGYGGYGGYGGTTAAEGAGIGIGQAAQGIGQGRVDTAQAASIYAQTAHQSIQNHNYAVNSYYANKDVHDKYMAEHAGPKVTQAEIEKYAKDAEPGRLDSAQYSREDSLIHWPPLLRDKAFTKSRNKIDHLFHDRTPDNSGVVSDNYGEIQAACNEMHATLKGMIHTLQPMTYIGAEHFIKSLAYEAEFPPKK